MNSELKKAFNFFQVILRYSFESLTKEPMSLYTFDIVEEEKTNSDSNTLRVVVAGEFSKSFKFRKSSYHIIKKCAKKAGLQVNFAWGTDECTSYSWFEEEFLLRLKPNKRQGTTNE